MPGTAKTAKSMFLESIGTWGRPAHVKHIRCRSHTHRLTTQENYPTRQLETTTRGKNSQKTTRVNEGGRARKLVKKGCPQAVPCADSVSNRKIIKGATQLAMRSGKNRSPWWRPWKAVCGKSRLQTSRATVGGSGLRLRSARTTKFSHMTTAWNVWRSVSSPGGRMQLKVHPVDWKISLAHYTTMCVGELSSCMMGGRPRKARSRALGTNQPRRSCIPQGIETHLLDSTPMTLSQKTRASNDGTAIATAGCSWTSWRSQSMCSTSITGSAWLTCSRGAPTATRRPSATSSSEPGARRWFWVLIAIDYMSRSTPGAHGLQRKIDLAVLAVPGQSVWSF